VSAAAGIVSEAAAMLFFRQNRVFQKQMQDSLRKLVSTQYLMTSVALARELPDQDRALELRSINDHLRGLMTKLHDLEGQGLRPNHGMQPTAPRPAADADP
jgi:hypothetical protein